MILHLITDRRRLAPGRSLGESLACLCAQARMAAGAGVNVVQIREPDLDAGVLARVVEAVMREVAGNATRVIVNERLDVALAVGAHGVHLPARSLPAAVVRRAVPAGFLVGCSVHDDEELAASAGADYLVAGTVWPTSSKPSGHRCLGIEGLRRLVQRAPVPVLAVGGVTTDRCAAVAGAGAAGVAAIGLFVGERGEAGCGAVALDGVVRAARGAFEAAGSS